MVLVDKTSTTIVCGSGDEKLPVNPTPLDAIDLQLGTRTVAQETKLREWLIAKMSAARNNPRPKAEMKKAATGAQLKFSARAFERSWHAAILETQAVAWSAPGRKPRQR
jgi:hypothetical protein